MRLKTLALFALLGTALSPMAALEELFELSPGQKARPIAAAGSSVPGALAASGKADVLDPILGAWTVDNAVTVKGFRGGTDYVLAPAAYRRDLSTDLLLHFESEEIVDDAGRWEAAGGRSSFRIDRSRAAIGAASASFRGASALSLMPGRGALLEKGARFRDFSIEFWLYPASAENGEVILAWQSVRGVGKTSLPQSFSCSVMGGRVAWLFQGFFDRPSMDAASAAIQNTRIELRARDPLMPRAWSHHLLRFDGDTGLLEYLVDGVTEATAYATSSGREAVGSAGDVYAPAVGAASPLLLCPSYSGLVDEFRVSRAFIGEPQLSNYGRDPGRVFSPVADLGYGNSHLVSVDLTAKKPGATAIELSYRISDEWAGWREESPAWTPFRPGEKLPDSARGRYVQIRADLYPDGSGKLSPSLSALVLHYEADPLPPPPARLVATAKDGAIELRWTRVPESDVAGYLVYYGARSGSYFGGEAAEGQSPIDAGDVSSFTLSGLPNGSLFYIVVAAYDAAGLSPGTELHAEAYAASGNSRALRAGEFSREVTARPLRTAQ
jgi:hypothetical protein